MAEVNLICLTCLHGPHVDKPCAAVGLGGVCGCQQWMRADIVATRALLNINNFLTTQGQQAFNCLVDILDMLCTQFPEAEKAVIERREQMRKDHESVNTPAADRPTEGITAGSKLDDTGTEAGDDSGNSLD